MNRSIVATAILITLVTATTTIAAADAPPSKPGSLNAKLYNGAGGEIFWARSTDDRGVSGYEITRNGLTLDVRDALSFYDPTLRADTAYTFTVTAIDSAGQRSSVATTRLGISTAPAAGAPKAPNGLKAIVYSRTSGELFWNRPSTVGLKYEVRRNGELVKFTDGVSYFTKSLLASQSYAFEVVAVDSSGRRSSPSKLTLRTNGTTSVPIDPTQPTVPTESTIAPTNITATIYSSTAVELFWTPAQVSTSPILKNEVRRNGILVATLPGGGARSYFDGTRIEGTAYNYEISAISATSTGRANFPARAVVPTASIAISTIYLDDETALVPTGGTFLVAEFIGDINNDGRSDLLVDTNTISFGPDRSDASAFETADRFSIASDLFRATVLDFNGNGVADVLLPNYAGNLPESPFGGFDLVFDRTDLSVPLAFDGANGGRVKGVEPGQQNLNFIPVGDVNGDGRDDLVGFLGGSRTQQGAATVVIYGALSLPAAVTEVTQFDGNSVDRLVPANGVRFESGRVGYILPLGDLNQDGFDDFALRYSFINNGDDNADRIYDMLFVYGSADGFDSVEAFNSDTALSIGIQFKGSLIQDTAGDFNADGVTDFVIATQSVENNRLVSNNGVLLGQDWQSQTSFTQSELAMRTIRFTGFSGNSGSLVIRPIGDFNGDGFDDLLVEDADRMVIIPAGVVGSQAVVNMKSLPAGSIELRANKDADIFFSYQFLDAQADVNGDGFSDVMVYSQAKGVRVLFGRAKD